MRSALLSVFVIAAACKEPSAEAPGPSAAPASAPPASAARASAPSAASARAATATPAATPTSDQVRPRPPSRNPAAARVVAIGDLHGDFEATRRVLRLVGAIDDGDHWSGGDMVLVQTGDQLDRGDGEQAIVDLFSRLVVEAQRAGGTVHVLNGNHELMNALGDLRYVTPGGFADFEDAVSERDLTDGRLAQAPEPMRARLAAFLPGGPYARVLAERNVAVIVGDTVFVHGGITPRYAEAGLDSFNEAARAWLLGEQAQPPPAAVDPEGPVWTRRYSQAVDAAACRDLEASLARLGVQRMVVGHTVQSTGITSACDGKVWRIDVGLAAHYGSARPQALEIVGGQVRVIAG